MNTRDDSFKLGVLIGYLRGLRHRAESNGWISMVADIDRILTELGVQ